MAQEKITIGFAVAVFSSGVEMGQIGERFWTVRNNNSRYQK
jgi:hypothetical protein